MSCTTSSSAGRPYGIQRVCRTWEQPRSSFYLACQGRRSDVVLTPAGKRGPKTLLSDLELLAMIKADLQSSPFQGEGHRKVWARLRVRDGVRVGRKRVLRIMRENNLLSPFRGRRGSAVLHDGQIVTHAPNLMWGTDGARVFTVDEGWVWIFSAVEHWNAECMGWHVCKYGSRFAALEPISQGLLAIAGSIGADVGRGLALRMDHGTQYLSDHFLNQLKYWGVSPSFAFVEQPQTNGVAERFNRTLKEQAIHGRIFQSLEDVRQAVADFVERYNDQWLVEKNGFKSPRQARRDWQAAREMLKAA
jgi:putative transposase